MATNFNGKVFNIAQNVDGRWCAADIGEGVKSLVDTPYIELVEYQQERNAVVNSLNYWSDFENKAAGHGSPYKDLYIATITNNIYILPYLMPFHHGISHKWAQGPGPTVENYDPLKWAVAKRALEATWAGVEQPEAWTGQNLQSIDVDFYLINTYKPDEDIRKNIMFWYQFSHQNMQGRPDAITYVPPCIYTMNIPGVRYSPACVVEGLKISNVGAMHSHIVPGIAARPFIVPDAWHIQFTIRELIKESREILGTVLNGNFEVVEAIEADTGQGKPGDQ